jgi:hypothetical protein
MPRYRALLISIFLLLLIADAVWPQGVRRTQQKPPPLPKFDLSGTLDRIEGGRVMLTTEAGYTWIVQMKKDLKVELTGKAKPAFLAPGQYIAFLAKLDKKRGNAVEKISRLTIFTPDKRRQPGIMPDLGFGELEKMSTGKRPGDDEPTTAGNRHTSDKPGATDDRNYKPGGEQKPGSSRKIPAKNVESFTIHGMITSVKNGEIFVQVPNNSYVNSILKIEVSNDADIDVELFGVPAIALVRQGDHIQTRGEQVWEGLGYTDHLTFRLSQPLGMPAAPKKPPPKSERPAKTKSAS